MSTKNQRCSSKERFWRRIMRQWRSSGLTIRDFCDQHQLNEPSFYYWRRTLAQRDAETARFVPVHVVPDENLPPTDSTNESGQGLELLLGSGHLLRIGPGFDGPTLQRLLALLQEGQS